MISFNIGILGAGHIAGVVAETLNALAGFSVAAVGASSEEKAKAFAEKYGVPKAYGSYEELVKDPDVELVYIATIHPNHMPLAKLCIDAGKPVLVEKPFAVNSRTAVPLIQYARDKKVFIGEAVWTRFTPLMDNLREVLAKGTIGEVRYVTASMGYNLRDKQRLVRPELAGGALLDLGIYPIQLISLAMGGLPAQMASSMMRTSTGVDGMECIQMTFPKGQGATALVSMMEKMDNRAVIYGTEGRIEVEGTNDPTCVTVFDKDGEIVGEYLPPENQISGYEYEFLAAREAIITGKLELDKMKHIETSQILSFMDALRSTWKLSFPLPGEPKPGEENPNAPKPVQLNPDGNPPKKNA